MPIKRAAAARSLWKDRFDSERTLSNLVASLNDPQPAVRVAVAESIGRLRHNPSIATDALRNQIESETQAGKEVDWHLISALAQLGTNARPAIPTLSELAVLTNRIGVAAATALSQIEPEESRWIDVLTASLGREADWNAFFIEKSTGDFGPATMTDFAGDALACVKFLKNRPEIKL